MRVLIVGGTSFVGPHIVRHLSDTGHEVAIFHRGQTEAELPAAVKHIHGDTRELAGFTDEFQRLKPDVVLHMIAGQAQDAWAFMRTFVGIANRAVVISSQDDKRAGILIGEKASQWRWTRGYVENVAHAIVLAVTNEQS